MLTEAASSIPAYKLWGALLGGGVEYLHMKSKHNTFFLSFLSWEGDSFFKSLFFFFLTHEGKTQEGLNKGRHGEKQEQRRP